MRGAPPYGHHDMNEGGHKLPDEPVDVPAPTEQESNMERFRGQLADKIRTYVNRQTGGVEGPGDRSLVGGLDDILRDFAQQ